MPLTRQPLDLQPNVTVPLYAAMRSDGMQSAHHRYGMRDDTPVCIAAYRGR